VNFTASSFYSELEPSKGRLNGPLAWCSLGDTAGEEYLQIHVPEAESICAIAIQGNGYSEGDEYVTEFHVKHSEDGSLWKEIEDGPGKIKVFCVKCLLLVVEIIMVTIMMITPYRKKVKQLNLCMAYITEFHRDL